MDSQVEWSPAVSRRVNVGRRIGSLDKVWATWIFRGNRHGTGWRVQLYGSPTGTDKLGKKDLDERNLAPGIREFGAGWQGATFHLWAKKFKEHYDKEVGKVNAEGEPNHTAAPRGRKRKATSSSSVGFVHNAELEETFFKNLRTDLAPATLKEISEYIASYFNLSSSPPVAVVQGLRTWRRTTGESWAIAPCWMEWLSDIGKESLEIPAERISGEIEPRLVLLGGSRKRQRVDDAETSESSEPDTTSRSSPRPEDEESLEAALAAAGIL